MWNIIHAIKKVQQYGTYMKYRFKNDLSKQRGIVQLAKHI